MGANVFEHISTGKNVMDAFNKARDEALYDHGHSSYTGTIAEKDSFAEFVVPDDSSAQTILDHLYNSYDGTIQEELNDLYGFRDAAKIAETFNDKRGPCVASQVKKNEWLFCGYANC